MNRLFQKSQQRTRQGAIMVAVLVWGTVAILMLGGFVEWAGGQIKAARFEYYREQAIQIAESGIEYYRWHLAHAPGDFNDGTGQVTNYGPFDHDYYDSSGNKIGKFVLNITPPASSIPFVTITSVGEVSVPLINTTIKRAIEVRMSTPSWAKYSVLSNSFLAFGADEEVSGEIHSNVGVRFDGTASNKVTASQETADDPDHVGGVEFAVHTHGNPSDPGQDPSPPASVPVRNTIFVAGREFPVAQVNFGALTGDLADLKEKATTDGYYFENSGEQGYHIVLKPNNTFDLYKVKTMVPLARHSDENNAKTGLAKNKEIKPTEPSFWSNMLGVSSFVSEVVRRFNPSSLFGGMTGMFRGEKFATVTGGPFDFTLKNDGPRTIAQGSAVKNIITATNFSGTPATASFSYSVSDLSADITASFSPLPSCVPDDPPDDTCSVDINIITSASTPPGTYQITVTGTGGATPHQTTFNLIVIPAPPFDFALSHPGNVSVNQGSSVTNTITATNVGLITGQDGSISLWMKPLGSSPSITNVFDAPAAIADRGGYMGIHRGTIGGLDRIWAYNYDGNQDKIGVSYTAGVWTHIVWVHANGTLSLYKNGLPAGSIPSGNTQSLNYILNAGSGFSATTFFNGEIDDVRMYARALTPGEVANLHAAAADPAGTTMHWKFDEGAGKAVADSSGNNVGGTFLNNGPVWIAGQPGFGQALSFDGIDDFSSANRKLAGVPAPVSFSVSGLPLGAEVSPAPTSCFQSPSPIANCQSAVTIIADSSTAPGDYNVTVTGTSGAKSAQTTFKLTVRELNFSLSHGGDKTTEQAMSVPNTITAKLLSGNMAPVSFSYSVSDPSAGITASFSPASASCVPDQPPDSRCSMTMTITPSASTPPKPDYKITVTGKIGTVERTTTFNLAVTLAPPFDFSLLDEPNDPINLTQEESRTNMITVKREAGIPAPVTLSYSVDDPSAGISFSDPAPCVPSQPSFKCSITMVIKTLSSTPPNTYQITVKGTAGNGATHSITFNLKVALLPPVIPFEFELSNEGEKSVNQGGLVTNKITATKTAGSSAAPVAFSVSGLPADVTPIFTPGSCTPSPAPCTSTLTMIARETAVPEVYNPITVTGTSGASPPETTTFKLTVQELNFSLTPQDASQSTEQGIPTSNPITAKLLSGNMAPVSFYAPALKGFWSFEGGDMSGATAYDRSGNGNDGVLNNMGSGTFVDGASGSTGKALSFDGVNDFIRIPNTPSLENIQEANYTLSAWFKPNQVPPGTGSAWNAHYSIISKTGEHSGLLYSPNYFVIEHWFTGGVWKSASTPASFPPGSFYHVAGVVNRTAGTVQIYVNGILRGTNIFTPNAVAKEYGTLPWHIGIANEANTANWAWPAHGVIDDVRIYNRPLSETEVGQLYNLGATKFLGQANANLNGLPLGISASLSTQSCTPDCPSTITVTPSFLVAPATYDIAVTGLIGSMARTTPFILTVTPAPPFDFSLLLGSPVVSVNQGGIATNAIIIKKTAGNPSSVALSVLGLPAGVTPSFNPGSCVPNQAPDSRCLSTLTLIVSATAAPGEYDPITITGTGGLMEHSETFTLTINPLNFSLSDEGDKSVNQGDQVTNKITAAQIAGSPTVSFSPPSLIGFWSFEDADISGTTALDFSQQTNHGTMIGMPTPPIRPLGASGTGKSLSFDGVNDKVSIPDSASLNPVTAFTVAAWVNPALISSTLYNEIITFRQGGVQFRIEPSTKKLRLWVINSAGAWVHAEGTTIIQTGRWTHVTGVKDGSALRVYVDGNFEGSGSSNDAKIWSPGAATMIGDHPASIHRFNGSLDDIRLYNRALSQAEVSQLYAKGANKFQDADAANLWASMPPGVNAVLSPTLCAPSPTCDSTLTMSASTAAVPGNYPIYITGADNGVIRQTSFSLRVVDPSAPTCSNSKNETRWGSWSIAPGGEEKIPGPNADGSYPFPANGLIFLADHTWVDGTIDNARLTIATAQFPFTESTSRDIIVNNNLLYTHADGRDTIGLIAQGYFRVGFKSADDLLINAAIIATKGGLVRNFYSSACGPEYLRTRLTITGAQASNLGGYFYFQSGSGYIKQVTNYDANLLYYPPPFFPLASNLYTTLSWEEVE